MLSHLAAAALALLSPVQASAFQVTLDATLLGEAIAPEVFGRERR